MKHINLFTIATALTVCLSSCVSEDQPWEVSVAGKGTMSLHVDLLRPESRAVSTANFPVTITNTATSEVVKSYESASVVPTSIILPVGQYTAEAHTPGNLEKFMDQPYYTGKEPFEILQKINTRAKVTCRMANGSFKVNYAEDFAQAFTSWTISIDDGSQSALTFTEQEGLTPAIVYMTFEPNTDKLTVNFRGTTSKGNTVASVSSLVKKQADEQYPTESPYFSGGDAIVLNFKPVESTEGSIQGITIDANISFEESTGEYPLDVEDKPNTGGSGEGEGGGDQEGDIQLNMPLPITMPFGGGSSLDPSLGDVKMVASAGIKSLSVKVESTNQGMVDALAEIGTQYNLDFLSGVEVVDNKSLEEFFTGLGQTLTVPSKGDSSYSFPIGNFFTFLQIMDGTHTFKLTLEDMKGNVKTGDAVVTVEPAG